MQQVITAKTLILSDLDGTSLDPNVPADQRQIDPAVRRAFEMFNRAYPNQVLPVTGRDANQVVDCFGGRQPNMSFISDNGAKLTLRKDGATKVVHFPFTREEVSFIEELRLTMRAFKNLYPGLLIEQKDFEASLHLVRAKGYEHVSDAEIQLWGHTCLKALHKLEAKAKGLGLAFSMGSAEATQHGLSCSRVDKLIALKEFAPHVGTLPLNDDWQHIVYFGDCFKKGNDRTIAAAVKKHGGTIIQVINHNHANVPHKDDVAHPHYILSSPQALGQWLLEQVHGVCGSNVIQLHTPPHDAAAQDARRARVMHAARPPVAVPICATV